MKILALVFASMMVTGAEAATLTYKYQGGELFIVGDVPVDNLEPLPTSWFAPSYILIIDEDLLPFSLAGNSIGGTPYDDEFPDGFGFDCWDQNDDLYVACLASQGFTFIANDYVGFPSRLHNIYSFTFDDDKKIISHFIDNSRDPETSISNPEGDFLDIMWYDSTGNDFTVFYASNGPGVWTGPLEPAPIPIPATGPLLIVALGALGALLRNTRRTVQAD